MVSFLGSMQYFLGKDVGDGDEINSGLVSCWFLKVLRCSLFESLCFSLATSGARIFICSCISWYFILSPSVVVSLAVVNVFL